MFAHWLKTLVALPAAVALALAFGCVQVEERDGGETVVVPAETRTHEVHHYRDRDIHHYRDDVKIDADVDADMDSDARLRLRTRESDTRVDVDMD